MNSRTCVWLLSPPRQFPATYCGKKTRYVIAKDEDNNPYRQHDHFCPEHRVAADALPPDEDE